MSFRSFLQIRPILIAFLVVFGAFFARPSFAHACIWNVAHFFLPWPPCTVEDQAVLSRVQNLNLQIAAKLMTIATQIQQVKTEIYQWQNAYETARNYERLLKRVWGDVTANPLPSMVVAFNHSSLGAYLRLDDTGGWLPDLRLADFSAQADSIRDAFMNHTDLERIYQSTIAPWGDMMAFGLLGTVQLAENQLAALGDWSRYSQIVRDSLRNIGNRAAARYEAHTDASGEAEAKISHLSIALSKLRGTAFEAQGMAISNRLMVLEMAAEQAQLLDRYRPMTATLTLY